MEDAKVQVATLQANNTADAAVLMALAADLSAAPASVGDQTLAAVVPVVTQAGLVSVFGAILRTLLILHSCDTMN